MLGRTRAGGEGVTEVTEMVGWRHQLNVREFVSKLWEMVKDREVFTGLQRVGQDLATEQ